MMMGLKLFTAMWLQHILDQECQKLAIRVRLNAEISNWAVF